MDRRTGILSVVFGALIAALVLKSVYPRWIEPMLTIDQRLAETREKYEKLKAQERGVERAKPQYEAFVARVGSFDIGKVENDIRDRLNELIEKHGLQGANVSPSRPTKDRKTGLEKMLVTVTATGALKLVVEFLKDVTELPQLVRVSNPAIYPASGSGRGAGGSRMNLRVPIEVWVLPQHKIVGRLDEEELFRPDSFIRHRDRDYSLIWDKEPLTEPMPLRAKAGRDVNVKQGERATLTASLTGGDGLYTYSWAPAEGLDDPSARKPVLDTSSGFTRTYTLTITDGHARTATDSVKVTVREPRKPRTPRKTVETPTPLKLVDKRWKDRRVMQLCMTLLHSTATQRVDELMISNVRSKQTDYYSVGDEFDGGELVFVHPTGGVVRRNDEYFIYPIGAKLDQDINVSDSAAADYLELKEAADRIRGAAEPKHAKQEATAGKRESPAAGAKPNTQPSGGTTTNTENVE